jgi:hypothetical protein
MTTNQSLSRTRTLPPSPKRDRQIVEIDVKLHTTYISIFDFLSLGLFWMRKRILLGLVQRLVNPFALGIQMRHAQHRNPRGSAQVTCTFIVLLNTLDQSNHLGFILQAQNVWLDTTEPITPNQETGCERVSNHHLTHTVQSDLDN